MLTLLPSLTQFPARRGTVLISLRRCPMVLSMVHPEDPEVLLDVIQEAAVNFASLFFSDHKRRQVFGQSARWSRGSGDLRRTGWLTVLLFPSFGVSVAFCSSLQKITKTKLLFRVLLLWSGSSAKEVTERGAARTTMAIQ